MPMTDPSNPYSPPADGGRERSPGPVRWQIEDGGILVCDQTRLPRVDLETGATEGDFMLVARANRIGPWTGFLGVVAIVILGFGVLPQTGVSLPAALPYTVGAVIAWRLGFRMLTARRVPVTVWLFREARRERRARLRERIRNGISLLMILLLAADWFYLGKPLMPWFFAIAQLIALVLLGNILWRLWDGPKPRVRSGPAGWVRFAPVHPRALEELERFQTEQGQNG